MATQPLFAASRLAALAIMTEPLPHHTSDQARLRAHLARLGHNQQEVSDLLQSYAIVSAAKRDLNL